MELVDVFSGAAYFIQEDLKEQTWIILTFQHQKIILIHLQAYFLIVFLLRFR